MDSLTHIVIGAAIGEAVLGKHIGKKAMLWGAFANTLPDFDMVMNFISNPVDALVIHRGITHSLLFALLAPFPIAWLFQKMYSKQGNLFGKWVLLFFLGFITHTLLDCMTAYGTGLWEPFLHHRVAFNNMFVADPLFTLPLIISSIALLLLKRNSLKRKTWNTIGISLSSLYIVMTIFTKQHVNSVVSDALENKNIHSQKFFTTPTALNNFLWMAIAESDTSFYVGYYSIFDKTTNVEFEQVAKNQGLLTNVESNELLETLKYFSAGYYCFTEKEGDIYFNDLRFGRISPWSDTKGPFVFQYKLTVGADNSMILEKGRWNSSSSMSDEFNRLIQRIKGI